MRIVVAFLIFVSVKAGHDYDLPEPGCVVVELKTHVECFTHSNGAIADPIKAQQKCASKGGQLAIIQHEKTWKLLIEKLPRDTSGAWLGFKVLPNRVKLIPNVDLKNMSAYWNPARISTSTQERYMYFQSNWQWQLSIFCEIDYLCQYNVTKKMYCDITDIDSNVIVNTCFEGNTVSHNTAVEIKCSPGYYLNSSRIITCRHGFWDKPSCVKGCPPPASKNHATSILLSNSTHFNIGDKIFYVCEDNYYNWQDFSKTHFILTCQTDSTWSDNDARCSLKQDYTTVTINATEISEDEITLTCGLLSANTTWTHNGREIVNGSAFIVSSQGDLFVQSNAEKIDGFYMCQTKIGEIFEIGNKAYSILGREKCKARLELSSLERLVREGESLILNCPQDSSDRQVKWFKNDEEIHNRENRKKIVGKGLYLKKLTQQDSGTYKCQTTYSYNPNNCKYNVTYYLTVTATTESICGVKRKNRSSFYQPWVVILQYEDESTPFCLGTLVNDRWVITSAFCLSSLRRKKRITGVFAQLGSRKTGKKYPILLVKIHPNYSNRLNLNDIGLIRLGGDPVEFNDDVLPVCISSDDIGNVHQCENRADLKGILTGWSANVTEKDDDVIVDSVETSLKSKNECRTSGVCHFSEDKFCTNKIIDEILFEPVWGDYGSPFVVSHNEKEFLLGIFTGEERNHSAYFTSIFHHYEWIKETIN